jgi:hypothetical protein
MNDMTPVPVRLTAERAKTMLEMAGARKVSVIGRGRMMLAIFQNGRKPEAWIIRSDGWTHNFANDVARELKAQ